jgi:hypothetical protein
VAGGPTAFRHAREKSSELHMEHLCKEPGWRQLEGRKEQSEFDEELSTTEG